MIDYGGDYDLTKYGSLQIIRFIHVHMFVIDMNYWV